MSSRTAPTLLQFVEQRREHDLPVHVAVERDRNSRPEQTDAVAKEFATLIADDGGAVVRDPDELSPGDAIVLCADGRPRRFGREWQKVRALASISRASSYAGLVATIPHDEVTTEVYHTADLIARMRDGTVEAVYRTHLDRPGAKWYLERVELGGVEL